jgi:hypothetical protein
VSFSLLGTYSFNDKDDMITENEKIKQLWDNIFCEDWETINSNDYPDDIMIPKSEGQLFVCLHNSGDYIAAHYYSLLRKSTYYVFEKV